MQDYVEERNGGYYIAGTRIGLDSIILSFKDGESPESILESFPDAGPLVKIYGAVTFYLENTGKAEAYLRDLERLWADDFNNPELPPRLAARLRERKEQSALKQARKFAFSPMRI